MSVFTLTQQDMTRPAILFPMVKGMSWQEVVHMSRFTQWCIAVGNLCAVGLFGGTFGMGTIRLVGGVLHDPELRKFSRQDLTSVAPFIVLMIAADWFVILFAMNAIKLTSYLLGRGYRG